MADIVTRRLTTQRLAGEPFGSATEAMRWFGPVQSQDYAAGKWALGMRVLGATDAALDRLFDSGAILRTHVMRPTWHFVLPADIRWIQELTSGRVMASLAGRHRQLELDPRTIGRAIELFGEALSGGRSMTRSELGEVLSAAGISADGQRLPHLISTAEHANVITSGPRRGKQFTYALLAERAKGAKRLDPERSLAELTVRYFRSRGPAQLKDFGWWSGLTLKQIRDGIHLAGSALHRETIDGNDYWFGDEERPAKNGLVAHLLPNFDEFTVAYRDRTALLDPTISFDPKLFAYYRDATPMGGMLSNIVTIGGRVRGAWSRTLTPKIVQVEIRPLAPFRPREESAIRRAAAALGAFLEREGRVTIRR